MSDQIKKEYTEKDFTETLDLMDKLATDKLKSIKSFIPIMFSIITSSLVLLLSEKIGDDKNSTIGFLSMISYLLFSLICLVIAYIPKCNYEYSKEKKHYFNPENSPFDIYDFYSYKIYDEDFVSELAKIKNEPLTINERLTATSIKQKVNAYFYKKRLINMVNFIFILGSALLIIGCIYYIVILKGTVWIK